MKSSYSVEILLRLFNIFRDPVASIQTPWQVKTGVRDSFHNVRSKATSVPGNAFDVSVLNNSAMEKHSAVTSGAVKS